MAPVPRRHPQWLTGFAECGSRKSPNNRLFLSSKHITDQPDLRVLRNSPTRTLWRAQILRVSWVGTATLSVTANQVAQRKSQPNSLQPQTLLQGGQGLHQPLLIR